MDQKTGPLGSIVQTLWPRFGILQRMTDKTHKYLICGLLSGCFLLRVVFCPVAFCPDTRSINAVT